eukprot:CAMPEP_0181191476 /NCGR_PEP_ID=MMETSP1096-20121128/12756_1 /TAXON_ID=156174 ORGANISM="Chrysochromulina ericina, Strain CCMP281" /NCGR_SAMPLE_ID=MMETSP1096 /ASSEMBLY_ACC=CAM_ASM_000453 /LENGTH=117 /DNA_ID=CAMNT_0023280779 /DNA_START=186 /DNA_END=539 /DNA_ORIENTATION=+
MLLITAVGLDGSEATSSSSRTTSHDRLGHPLNVAFNQLKQSAESSALVLKADAASAAPHAPYRCGCVAGAGGAGRGSVNTARALCLLRRVFIARARRRTGPGVRAYCGRLCWHRRAI